MSNKTKKKNSRMKSRVRTRKRSKDTVASQKKLVLSLLRELKWPRTQRPNVLRKSHVEKSEKTGYEGFVLGIVTSWAGKGEKSGYRKVLSLKTHEPKYKKLFKETKKLMRLRDPKFKFTSIQFNKNHRTARHRDASNVGVSYIVGLGNYTGGDLIVFDENEENPVKHNIRNKFYSFNGSKYPHETSEYKGERYTLVFYST